MSRHIVSIRSNVVVYVALMVLLGATVGGAHAPLGRFHLTMALVIAVAKALLVILFFMHVRQSSRLTWVFSGAAFLWLGIMLVLSAADYVSRDLLGIAGK
jgi:cytochrome c oxidase subunit 4